MQFQRFLKRQMDMWVSLISLIVFAIPFLVIAILIKLESPGPVFFLQERLGENGKIFKMFKFRSMVQGAAHMGAGLEVVKNDSRVTRIGRFLRRTRVDEYPQLLQILLGQMSLVGPRPAFPHHLEKYTEEEKKRLSVRPGFTNMDILKGGNALSWPERIKWDLWYIDHWSLWLDIKIILGSFRVVLTGEDEEGGAKGVVEDYK
ncbi:MAG: sugar transferase [Candidatus Wildermuthbacteria bacterium RIFCSPLOWO2_01_FULL_47_18]|uniref:Sugar transferase n=2 Tax=Candidatus Wildermuthiibacteriota TaxID=1817923 RepID=A0A1G2RGX5_9BACT|nr:MAG: sugar transferase [Candidatus Wildermuthbacteria bacterium RIFCSPHIGHO2_02_FULL_48_16]OHA72086.1 MAG: sugar transferase [Candidatus Wildermuthbacteria bacterium RIFCSPLOWO2_01_FULL_47_18]